MPTQPNNNYSERERIQTIYAERDRLGKKGEHAWHIPVAAYQDSIKRRLLTRALQKSIGNELSDVSALDVGCGIGGFLRMLVEYGANPTRLVGTEFLQDRLETARLMSPSGITWHLGGLDQDFGGDFDLVCAQTVFTSILDDALRKNLADKMWEHLKPGGWVLVFDFRYNNPSNKNVRKVTRKELLKWWPSTQTYYFTDMLAPPLARLFVSNSWLIVELITLLVPFLRSHFVYVVRKPI